MNTIILTSLSIASVLFIWFKTGVFVEYVRLLKLEKIFKVDVYLATPRPKPVPYLQWLGATYGKYFLIRLLLCPFCVGFWLSIVASIFTTGILTALAIYCLTIIIYLSILKLTINK